MKICQVGPQLFHADISSGGHADRNDETNWSLFAKYYYRTDQFTILLFLDNTILHFSFYLY